MDIKVVTICGSMKYQSEMIKIAGELELKYGYAVIQCIYDTDKLNCTEEDYKLLDRIHKKKIDISDAIYVVNINGYIGNSTKSEIEYALNNEKEIIYHEEIN